MSIVGEEEKEDASQSQEKEVGEESQEVPEGKAVTN